MRARGTARVENKRDARIWLLTAIQSCQFTPTKECEFEIKRFIRRIQRDISSLNRALVQIEKDRKKELAALIQSQKRDAK